MTSNEILYALLRIFAEIGGAGVLILGLSSWIGKIWADRIYQKSSAKYSKELEELRNGYANELEQLRFSLLERRETMSNLLGTLATGYLAAHEKILASHRSLWQYTLNIREFTTQFIFFYAVLHTKEYMNNPIEKYEKILPMTTQEEIDARMYEISKAIEPERPMIGEKLWTIYQIYFGFSFRMVYKVRRWTKNRQLHEWDKDFNGDDSDDAIFDLLKTVLSEHEINKIVSTYSLGTPQGFITALEQKILTEMNKWAFGKPLIDMSIEEQQRIKGILRQDSPS